MDQFYQINDAIDDLYLTITIMNVIDTISHQIGIPIAIYVVLAALLVLIVDHGVTQTH